MSEAKTPEDKKLTAAEAAKRVKRPVTVRKGDVETTKLVPVGAKEVLAFRDYGSHVVVVTVDGQKFSSVEAEAAEAEVAA